MASMWLVAFVVLGAFVAQNSAQMDPQLMGTVAGCAQANGMSMGEKNYNCTHVQPKNARM